MKKLIGFILVALMLSSCSYNYNMSVYQNKNIRKFTKAKRVRYNSHRYIRPGKRGYLNGHNTTKETRREIKRRINADRLSVSSY